MFEATVEHIRSLQGEGKKVVVAGWSDGSRERLGSVLAEHGLKKLETVSSLSQALSLRDGRVALAVIGLEAGFVAGDLAVIGEQDILGDRLAPQRRRKKRGANFLAEVAALSAGDLVVHVDHGIGRFIGLKQIEAAGAPHDCLELHYFAGDKLFVPVENIELLTRYGSDEAEATLDRLGHSAWRERKARLKLRIRHMAQGLIKIAAARALHEAPKFTPPEGLYEEFCARFPYDETDDQLSAIEATLGDMASGKPMDRLICGDVGFGKTEVALRAAFAAAIEGVAGRGGGADHAARPPALQEFHRAFCRPADPAGANVAHGHRRRHARGARGRGGWFGRYRHRHPCRARQAGDASRISGWSSSTRSSILASATRKSSRNCAPPSMC